jgi:hypothetical protein
MDVTSETKSQCERCGEYIQSHRKLCDICRSVSPIFPHRGPDWQIHYEPSLKIGGGSDVCMHDQFKPGEVTGMSCPCPKCSPRC